MRNKNNYVKTPRLNQKGVFITLTALFLAGLLILASTNLQKSRNLEENATALALASERNYFVKQNLTDEIRNAYANSGITWQIDGNKFTYAETIPLPNAKNKISQNLLKIKSFFYKNFPQNPNFLPENIDAGKIFLYDKNLNISHSQTSGFGTNTIIYINYSSQKFASAKFDLNIASSTVILDTNTLPSCGTGCAPLTLSITARNSGGTIIYSFNGTVDLNKTGKVDFNTPAASEVSFDYNAQMLSITTITTQVSIKETLTFNDPYLDVGIDQNGLVINEMSAFGIKG
ncbi:MAG: hypothetical protein WCI04_02570 [archaeon]